MRVNIFFQIFLISIIILTSCTDSPNDFIPSTKDSLVKVTFVELGSETCIPCQMMRPIMDSTQKKYGSKILVKFIDALRDPIAAEPFKIRLMPTQVFLDSTNKEFYRHEGLLSQFSIDSLLEIYGLKPL